MTALEVLLPSAVLGTARRGLDLSDVPSALLAEGIADLPVAQGLLAVAARAALVDRITLPPGTSSPPAVLVGPLPETRWAPGSLAYVGSLAQAVGGQRWAAVVETLRDLDQRGLRVPVGTLHHLLELAVTRVDVRRALGPVLGERGRWLARNNPRWQFDEWLEADPEDTAVWQRGSASAQTAWMHAVRETNPDRARETLTAALPQLNAAARASVVRALRTGLGPEDEPLLESLLDDRAREVRETARDLLPLLPGSEFVQRMRRRLAARVELRRGRRWEVDLGGLGPDDARDGVTASATERPPGSSGVRALVGGVPLAVWREDFRIPATDVVRLRYGPLELGPLPGLRDAAIREWDADVAVAVLRDPNWAVDPALVECACLGRPHLAAPILDRLLASRVRTLGIVESLPELRVEGFGRETAGVLLKWLADSASFGNRTAVFAVLGNHGPDVAAPLRELGARMVGADRNRAFDAAMTINLRRSLRAEAAAESPTPNGEP